ncbi:MAG: RHS repeat-associated core domain-containing protein [Prevotella sp.]|nr:RHS repeat-associated core domain-containing protein [Prevotella sp.]
MAQPNVTWAFGVQPDVSQSQPIFAGHTDYLVGGRLIVKEDIIKKLFFDGGYVDATVINNPKTYGFTPYYYNKDHLGNNREVVDRSSNVQQLTNYYPFGAPYADPVAVIGSTIQPYKYNGQELDTMHGLNTYDYGARQYNPIIGRWDRMDPLCEKYYSTSPYVYCLNNPVKSIDPDGRAVETVWDALNVGLGIASCAENIKSGNYGAAIVAGLGVVVDAAAAAIPGIPGGVGSAIKAFRKADNFREKVEAGRKFEKAVVNAAKKQGRDVSTQITVVPKNGLGNTPGNRSRVDMIEKKKDGTYCVTEIKLSPNSRPSKGQKSVEKHVKDGNRFFEVRSDDDKFHKGQKIEISEYRYVYKNK